MKLFSTLWVHATILVALAVLTVGLVTESSFGFAGGIIKLLPVALALLFGLAGLACLCWKHRGHALRWFTAGGVLAGSWGFGLLLCKYQIQESFTAATPILDALEAHRDLAGQYPDRLDNLVPKFLPKVPRSQLGYFGGAFTYLKEDAGYSLSFETTVWTRWSYHSAKKDWSWSD